MTQPTPEAWPVLSIARQLVEAYHGYPDAVHQPNPDERMVDAIAQALDTFAAQAVAQTWREAAQAVREFESDDFLRFANQHDKSRTFDILNSLARQFDEHAHRTGREGS